MKKSFAVFAVFFLIAPALGDSTMRIYKPFDPLDTGVYYMSYGSTCNDDTVIASKSGDIITIRSSCIVDNPVIQFVVPVDRSVLRYNGALWEKPPQNVMGIDAAKKYYLVEVNTESFDKVSKFKFAQDDSLYLMKQLVDNKNVIPVYIDKADRSLLEKIYGAFNGLLAKVGIVKENVAQSDYVTYSRITLWLDNMTN